MLLNITYNDVLSTTPLTAICNMLTQSSHQNVSLADQDSLLQCVSY